VNQKGTTIAQIALLIMGIVVVAGAAFYFTTTPSPTEEEGETPKINFEGVSSATAVGADKIDLEWTALTPAESYFYRIYASTTSGGQDFENPTASTAFGDSSYRLTGLQAGTTYYIVVRAFPSTGNATDTNTKEIAVTTDVNANWEVEHVDESTDDVGLFTSLKVDSGDNWNIFYTNATDNQIWMAGPEVAPPYFQTRAFPKGSDLTCRAFIDISDNDDHFELVYYNITDNAFYFAEQTTKDIGVCGSYCDVPNGPLVVGEVGRYASLKIDSNGDREIVFYDSESGDLKYVRITREGTVGNVTTIDSTGNVGQYCSLAIDGSTNLPGVSYYDATNGNLKYAVKNADGSWSVETVDSSGDVGRYSSLVIDSSGVAYIAYYDADSKNLKFAMKSGSSWTKEVIDNTADVGAYCSLALDSQGNLGVSYYDGANGDLKYAYRSAGSWTIQTVVANDNVGMHTSLDFTSDDKAVISYYDATRGDLWIAIEH